MKSASVSLAALAAVLACTSSCCNGYVVSSLQPAGPAAPTTTINTRRTTTTTTTTGTTRTTTTSTTTRRSSSLLFGVVVATARRSTTVVRMSGGDDDATIVSPFDDSNQEGGGAVATSTATTAAEGEGDSYLELTWENVDQVLDEMRPYLIQDGGNVKIAEIDGPVVKLQLEGACGTCPSSTQTMKMGLERGLKEKIPEIQEVIQSMPEGPELSAEQIDVVLDGVRPFLQVAGGDINLDRLEGVDGLQPTIWLHMSGNSASLNSVKLEIAQRLQRHFMMAGLQVQWKDE